MSRNQWKKKHSFFKNCSHKGILFSIFWKTNPQKIYENVCTKRWIKHVLLFDSLKSVLITCFTGFLWKLLGYSITISFPMFGRCYVMGESGHVQSLLAEIKRNCTRHVRPVRNQQNAVNITSRLRVYQLNALDIVEQVSNYFPHSNYFISAGNIIHSTFTLSKMKSANGTLSKIANLKILFRRVLFYLA